MSKYIVHKAIELKNLAKSSYLAASLAVDPEVVNRTFYPQLKYDGCNLVVVVPEDFAPVEFYSRTGETVFSMGHLAEAFSKHLAPGVYLGEAWLEGLEFPVISGIFRRKTVKPGPVLGVKLFDYLTLAEWEQGGSARIYLDRLTTLHSRLGGLPFKWWSLVGTAETYAPGTFQDPAKQASKLQEVGGYDGLILRDPRGTWTKGDDGTRGEIIKVKPLIRVSCAVVGYEPGKGKHAGKIGTLLVDFAGKRQGAGTGLKDKERAVDRFEEDWLGRIVEIEALGLTPDGMLREPRLLGIREDVVEADK